MRRDSLVVEVFLILELRRVGLGELLQRFGVVIFHCTAIFEKRLVLLAELETLLGVSGDVVELILRRDRRIEIGEERERRRTQSSIPQLWFSILLGALFSSSSSEGEIRL